MVAFNIGALSQLGRGGQALGGDDDFLKKLAEALQGLSGGLGTTQQDQPQQQQFPIFPEFTAQLPPRSLGVDEINPFLKSGQKLKAEQFDPGLLRQLGQLLNLQGF